MVKVANICDRRHFTSKVCWAPQNNTLCRVKTDTTTMAMTIQEGIANGCLAIMALTCIVLGSYLNINVPEEPAVKMTVKEAAMQAWSLSSLKVSSQVMSKT